MQGNIENKQDELLKICEHKELLVLSVIEHYARDIFYESHILRCNYCNVYMSFEYLEDVLELKKEEILELLIKNTHIKIKNIRIINKTDEKIFLER